MGWRGPGLGFSKAEFIYDSVHTTQHNARIIIAAEILRHCTIDHNREEIIFDRKRSPPDPSYGVISSSSESWAHQPGADKDNDCFLSICGKHKRRGVRLSCQNIRHSRNHIHKEHNNDSVAKLENSIKLAKWQQEKLELPVPHYP